MNKKVVTVFGSARTQEGTADFKTAYELGKLLAQSGFTVCNGGYGGTMEASARGARDAGGKTIGIVAETLGVKANPFIAQKEVVRTHLDRLLRLVELGDAYIVLNGGTGTLLELAYVWEYINKHIMPQKPVIVVGDFWSTIIDTVRKELQEEKGEVSNYVRVVHSPEECVNVLIRRLND